MANPITWRNVGATVSGSGVASLMQGADDSVTRGFSALGNVLDERRKLSDENFNTRQTNLAADFQDRIQQAQTLDELNALREDPVLAQLRSQLTGEYRNQVRGSLDNRETGLIDQIGKRQGFQDTQTMRDLRPQMRQWQARALQGDDSWIGEAAQAGITDDAALEELYGLFTTGMNEQRAQEQNQRSLTIGDYQIRGLERTANREDANDWASTTIDNLADRVIRGEVSNPQQLEELRDELRANLAGNEHISGSEADAYLARFDQQVLGNATVSPIEGAFVEQEVAKLERDLGLSNDPYYRGLTASDKAGQQVTQEVLRNWMNEDNRLFNNADTEEREEMVQQGYRLASEGIDHEYRDASGRKQTIKVPFDGAMLDLMAMSVEGKGGFNPFRWDMGSSLENNAKRFLEANPGLVNAQRGFNEVQGARRDLERGAQQAAHPLAELLQFYRSTQ